MPPIPIGECYALTRSVERLPGSKPAVGVDETIEQQEVTDHYERRHGGD
jgi:hypothetical protein